ncbi:GNAT family N-acetyltransferase [Microlunatus capsulatus]|uniref:GNAT superfamily N-acetyltransferase n=1 Tax=Microlunatus capsulatus TaxID=99117 RepID=A0ABS4Z448_9ACTN|nr:GNAT family N-acetyltransferase [Microlunatus capsulatus]MBP2415831.1 GNAT superfamily N-acetyltransferase [Microlunatus capsulatus]
MADERTSYTVRPLDASTWEPFAELVERNGGVFGGCWCMGHHATEDGTSYQGIRGLDKRAAKEDLVRTGRAHAALVLDDAGVAQGWAKFGRTEELPILHQHRRAYEKDEPRRPDWRVACFYTDTRHRREGIARAALGGALDLIAAEGGGTVEAIPEVTDGRVAAGRFLFVASVELFEDHGFERVRQLGKWAWLVRRTVPAGASAAALERG